MPNYHPLPFSKVILSDERLLRRRKDNYDYLMKLSNDNLIRNFEYEAGLFQTDHAPDNAHGGWENPYCQLRGHFLGHWLSAAAQNFAATQDAQLKAKADALIDRLAVCQIENGGQWAGSIPQKYLDRIAVNKPVWAPQYTLHKTFMGLLDMYEYAGSGKALEIAENWAGWFHAWSAEFTREQFDDILDFETGGMLEIWARLYGCTGREQYSELMDRYYRSRLFDALLEERDVLTNMHANTTIPEIMGAAAAYRATGAQKWLDICFAYWNMAVTARGTYCTGGQTLGEVWTPPQQQLARLGEKNQEHCTVYNMMRLADFLFEITGDAKYADCYEQNLYNGIFAQGYWHGRHTHGAVSAYPEFGLLTYFLPLQAGGRKGWAHETQDFYCCHGTLVQANSTLQGGLLYTGEDSISICQFFAFSADCDLACGRVVLDMDIETLSGQKRAGSVSANSSKGDPVTARVAHNPHVIACCIRVRQTVDAEVTLRVRAPWWLSGKPSVSLNGKNLDVAPADGFITLRRKWKEGDELYVELPRGLHCWPMPDAPDMVAFMDGPVVLAGLTDEERVLYGDIRKPETMLRPDNEREWGMWRDTYHTLNLDRGFRFIPLYMVGYEPYTIYFPVQAACRAAPGNSLH